jgi:molybdopterin converting factor small subunit
VRVTITFFSYFKDLTGCDDTRRRCTGQYHCDLQKQLFVRFPKLAAMQNSTLIAVGVEYQGRSYVLQEGDEVSLFPPGREDDNENAI